MITGIIKMDKEVIERDFEWLGMIESRALGIIDEIKNLKKDDNGDFVETRQYLSSSCNTYLNWLYVISEGKYPQLNHCKEKAKELFHSVLKKKYEAKYDIHN